MKNSKEYKFAKYQSMQHFGANESTDKAFEAGFDFATSQPKHIFDGAAKAGEVRRFDGKLVDVVNGNNTCVNCMCHKIEELLYCEYLTGCVINNVKYRKR